MENWSEDFLDSFLLTSFFQVDKGRTIHFEDKDYPQLDAADKSDFETIFKREFDKRGYNKDDFEFSNFSKILEDYVEKLIKLHTNQRGVKNLDDNSIKLGYQFIDFLKENKFYSSENEGFQNTNDLFKQDSDNKNQVNLLKEKFIKSDDYDRVIQKLVEEKRIVFVGDEMLFKPIRGNTRFEPFVLLQVLSDLSFFKEPVLKDTVEQQIHLLKNVFKGFTASKRAYHNKSKGDYYNKYKDFFELF